MGFSKGCNLVIVYQYFGGGGSQSSLYPRVTLKNSGTQVWPTYLAKCAMVITSSSSSHHIPPLLGCPYNRGILIPFDGRLPLPYIGTPQEMRKSWIPVSPAETASNYHPGRKHVIYIYIHRYSIYNIYNISIIYIYIIRLTIMIHLFGEPRLFWKKQTVYGPALQDQEAVVIQIHPALPKQLDHLRNRFAVWRCLK